MPDAPEVQRLTRSKIAAERALETRQFMQEELVRGVGLQSDTQMNMRTVGEQAEHIVRGRALWVHKVLGVLSLEPMMNWDEPDDPPRSAAESAWKSLSFSAAIVQDFMWTQLKVEEGRHAPFRKFVASYW